MAELLARGDPVLILYYRDGSYAHIDPAFEPTVEEALAKLVGEDRKVYEDPDRDERDTLLRLFTTDGIKVVVLASGLFGYSLGYRVSQATAKGEPADDKAGSDAHTTEG